MKILLSLVCIVLISSSVLAKKSAKEQAANTAANLKDKVVETVGEIGFIFNGISSPFFNRSKMLMMLLLQK